MNYKCRVLGFSSQLQLWANERNLHIISASLGFQFRRYALGGLQDCQHKIVNDLKKKRQLRS